jgi:hypothetical protein
MGAGGPIPARSSTWRAQGAIWLGYDHEVGVVGEGFLADLLVLEENPIEADVTAFRSLRHVIADGRLLERRAAAEPWACNARGRGMGGASPASRIVAALGDSITAGTPR